MIKRLFLFFILGLLAGSCKKEEKTVEPRLMNCEINFLRFADDPRYFHRSEYEIDISFDGSPGILYTYENGKVARSTGGITMMGFGSLWLTMISYDSLVYAGNRVMVYGKPFSPYLITQTEDPDRPTIYEYDKDGRLTAIIRRDQSVVNYSYQGDIIAEVNPMNGSVRNFYFDNGNLIKIVRKTGSPELSYYHLREILLQDYDDNPNPFKGLFHLPGAFFRAFSENNYAKITISDYSSTDNVIFEQYYQSVSWRTLTYNEAGYPLFGVYE
jgi:YD repeat-containing protein